MASTLRQARTKILLRPVLHPGAVESRGGGGEQQATRCSIQASLHTLDLEKTRRVVSTPVQLPPHGCHHRGRRLVAAPRRIANMAFGCRRFCARRRLSRHRRNGRVKHVREQPKLALRLRALDSAAGRRWISALSELACVLASIICRVQGSGRFFFLHLLAALGSSRYRIPGLPIPSKRFAGGKAPSPRPFPFPSPSTDPLFSLAKTLFTPSLLSPLPPSPRPPLDRRCRYCFCCIIGHHVWTPEEPSSRS